MPRLMPNAECLLPFFLIASRPFVLDTILRIFIGERT